MQRRLFLAALTLMTAGCLFGGPASPTLEMQNPPSTGAIDLQIIDSAVEPDEIYLKLAVHNGDSRPLLVDRRALVLSDGRSEWRSAEVTKPFLTVKPGASGKLKLTFKGAPAGRPTYDFLCKKGAFKFDNERGQEVTVPTVRLLVRKGDTVVPEPSVEVPAR